MAIRNIPAVLIDFEVYNEQDNRLFGIADVTLPELNHMTQEISGVGILGKTNFPIRGALENMETTFNFRVLTESGTSFLGQNSHSLILRHATDMYDSADGTRRAAAWRIAMRGLTTAVNLGKLQAGEASDTEVKLALDYLKIECDGETLVEIDRFNHVFAVKGEDQLADVKAALGL